MLRSVAPSFHLRIVAEKHHSSIVQKDNQGTAIGGSLKLRIRHPSFREHVTCDGTVLDCVSLQGTANLPSIRFFGFPFVALRSLNSDLGWNPWA